MKSDRWPIESVLNVQGTTLSWPIWGSAQIDDENAEGYFFLEIDGNFLELAHRDKVYDDASAEHELDIHDVWFDCEPTMPDFIRKVSEDAYAISLPDLQRIAKEQGVKLGLALAGKKSRRVAESAKSIVDRMLGS